ncbi:unnamed protein product [Coregonus sp. 'balchen']|nr:unnamed protein product [Coregonus sp. 'balchen']
MPAKSLRWETLEALKNYSKGRLKYNPDWLEKGEEILSGCNEAPSLSPLSGLILKRLNVSPRPLQKTSLGSASRDPSPGLSEEAPVSSTSSFPSANDQPTPRSKKEEEQQIVGDEESAPDTSDDLSPVSNLTISLLSPRATQMAGLIHMCEKKHCAKAKMELSLRQELQEMLGVSVASRESEQLKRFEELMELKQRHEYQSLRDMMDRETENVLRVKNLHLLLVFLLFKITQETLGRQEKLKEEHKNRIKKFRKQNAKQSCSDKKEKPPPQILNLRMREAEKGGGQGETTKRYCNSISSWSRPHPPTQSDPTPDLTSYSTRANQLCSQVSEVVRTTAEGEFSSVEDLTVAERALHEMRSLIRVMQEAAAQAQEKRKKEQGEEERRKLAELQAQQEEQKKNAALSAKEKAQKKELQVSANQCAQYFEGLNNSKDIQTKEVRMELQKAAAIPVSQISSISGCKLSDIFDKIDKLLSGRLVVSGGKSVSTSQHPNGMDFVSYKLAEKFVKQGEEEVSSHHEAAFPIAVVASGVWELSSSPTFTRSAPLPTYEGWHSQILGYRVEDGGVEVQDSFLKRWSGMIRLYAAIIQLRWPYVSKQGPDPHGMNHSWRWLAQMLNMAPLADVTATLLFDFLEVIKSICGNALMKQYQVQFWKLILLIKEEFLPSSLRSKHIPPPKGQLSSHFWRS